MYVCIRFAYMWVLETLLRKSPAESGPSMYVSLRQPQVSPKCMSVPSRLSWCLSTDRRVLYVTIRGRFFVAHCLRISVAVSFWSLSVRVHQPLGLTSCSGVVSSRRDVVFSRSAWGTSCVGVWAKYACFRSPVRPGNVFIHASFAERWGTTGHCHCLLRLLSALRTDVGKCLLWN